MIKTEGVVPSKEDSAISLKKDSFLVPAASNAKAGDSLFSIPSEAINNLIITSTAMNSFSIKKRNNKIANVFGYIQKTESNGSKSNFKKYEELSVNVICDELLRTLKTDEYVEGECSKTQLLLEKMFEENPINADKAFTKAWLALFSQKNTTNLFNFISICSSLDYSLLNFNADTLVLSCFSHHDPKIKEATIRAIESWENPSFIYYLENMSDIEYQWLDTYKKEVMEYLRSL